MSNQTASSSLQIFTFVLQKETFAFEISEIREVIDFVPPTAIPGTPEFMLGVINIRGNAVPVIDLKLKLGIGKTVEYAGSCIIIVEVLLNGGKNSVGVVADSVKEVITIEQNQIEPPPNIGTGEKNDFIKGIGKQNSDFIIIFDIAKIFSTNQNLSIAEILIKQKDKNSLTAKQEIDLNDDEIIAIVEL